MANKWEGQGGRDFSPCEFAFPSEPEELCLCTLQKGIFHNAFSEPPPAKAIKYSPDIKCTNSLNLLGLIAVYKS